MPTYDYRCQACGHELELFQSMTEGPKRKCPACSALKLKRLIGTGGGILFKGAGFYQTDYRSSSYQKAAKADREGDKKPAKDGGKPADKDSGKDSGKGGTSTSGKKDADPAA